MADMITDEERIKKNMRSPITGRGDIQALDTAGARRIPISFNKPNETPMPLREIVNTSTHGIRTGIAGMQNDVDIKRSLMDTKVVNPLEIPSDRTPLGMYPQNKKPEVDQQGSHITKPIENAIPRTSGSAQIKNTETPTLRDMPPTIYNDVLKSASDQYGVPYQIGYNLLNAESGFNPDAVSTSGAQGIAQFMPSTAKDVGINPMDPNEAIPGAMKYLKAQYDRFGSWPLALAAYNAGPGNVNKYGDIPPFKETQDYVAKIMGDYSETGNRMKSSLSGPSYSRSEIPTSGLLHAKNPVDVNSPDYIPDRTIILGGNMETTDYGAGLAYDQNGNLVPGMSPDRVRIFGPGSKLLSDSDRAAMEPYVKGQEHERSIEKQVSQGNIQKAVAEINSRGRQASAVKKDNEADAIQKAGNNAVQNAIDAGIIGIDTPPEQRRQLLEEIFSEGAYAEKARRGGLIRKMYKGEMLYYDPVNKRFTDKQGNDRGAGIE